ncbi:hypothetical protein Slin14017_G055330 [Septoria linicola]|nr:hypothetical protein Slin14017_G055330 [Septoria linicola]
MDPNTSTREQWTAALVSQIIPNDANAQYKSYTEGHQKLYNKLAHHAAMVPNLEQTFMTPAASKNKVYFMW